MIRPVTFVTTMLALSSGAWMFVVKHQAEQLDRQIGGVTSQIRASEQRIRVLRAEWALETDPNRIARLAALFLPGLKPMAPDQLVTWSELADRLPPVGAEVPHLPLPPPLPDQLPAPMVATPGPIASTAAPTSEIALPPSAVPVASSSSAPATAAPVAPHPTIDLAATHATTPVAGHAAPRAAIHQATQSMPMHHAIPVIRHVSLPVVHHVASHPQPLGQSVLGTPRTASHTVRPMGAQVMTINAQTSPRPVVLRPRAPAPVAQTNSISVFGGYGSDLPPPRPAP